MNSLEIKNLIEFFYNNKVKNTQVKVDTIVGDKITFVLYNKCFFSIFLENVTDTRKRIGVGHCIDKDHNAQYGVIKVLNQNLNGNGEITHENVENILTFLDEYCRLILSDEELAIFDQEEA